MPSYSICRKKFPLRIFLTFHLFFFLEIFIFLHNFLHIKLRNAPPVPPPNRASCILQLSSLIPLHVSTLAIATSPLCAHTLCSAICHSFKQLILSVMPSFIYLFVYFLCIPLPISEMSCQVSRQSPQQDNKRTCIHSMLARCARSLPLECKYD